MKTLASDVSFRLGLLLCLILSGCTSSCDPPIKSGNANPQAYSCDSSTPGQSDCFASVHFASAAPQGPGSFVPLLFGYRTDVLVAQYISGGDGLIGASLKLNGSTSTVNSLEVGYFSSTHASLNCGVAGGGLFYFFRFVDAGTETLNCLGLVPPGDVGRYVTLEIASVGVDLTQSNSFAVRITSVNTNLTNLTPCSTAAPCRHTLWSPGGTRFADVELLQTLRGKTGAYSSIVYFTNNSYETASNSWAPQSGDGRISSDNPPFAGVMPTGGSFFVECCTAPTTVYPQPVGFGTVQVGGTSPSQRAIITNVKPSSGPMNITGIDVTGPNAPEFSIDTNNCGSSLAPLASCTVTLTFRPSSQGPKAASLTVTDSGGGGSGTDASSFRAYGQ